MAARATANSVRHRPLVARTAVDVARGTRACSSAGVFVSLLSPSLLLILLAAVVVVVVVVVVVGPSASGSSSVRFSSPPNPVW